MELLALVGFILIIAVTCSLFDIDPLFKKLLYYLCAILVLVFIIGFFFGFPGHFSLR